MRNKYLKKEDKKEDKVVEPVRSSPNQGTVGDLTSLKAEMDGLERQLELLPSKSRTVEQRKTRMRLEQQMAQLEQRMLGGS